MNCVETNKDEFLGEGVPIQAFSQGTAYGADNFIFDMG